MSKITIDYSEINSAAKKARSVSGYYEDFEEELEKKVSKKLSGLPGYDSKGHISNAKSYASSKVKELREKKKYFSDLATNIEKLADNVEIHEKNVVSGVKKIATETLELKNQSKWQAFCQWAYGTFCVDMVNWNPITRGIGNGIKKGLDWVQEKGTKIVDWFKHGEGKYMLGIVLDALAVAGAIAATVIAIELAVATGGAALVVAAVFSTIGTVMTMVDVAFSAVNKFKAIEVERETGDPGRARYYGNIDGVSDTIDKTDMGGKTANAFWGAVGTGYDVLHVAADITAGVSGTIGAAGLTGTKVQNAAGKWELKTTYDRTKIKSNLKSTMLEKIGWRNTSGKWTFNIKNLFSMKRHTGTIPRTEIYKKDIIGDKIGDLAYKRIDSVKEITDRIYKKITHIETINSPDSSSWDCFKSGMGYISASKVKISSPVGDLNDTILEIVDTVIEIAL